MARAQSIAMKLVLALLAPVLLLAGMELALRITGAGYPTALWVPDVRENQVILRDNEFFTYRFVPPPMARIADISQMARDKPADTLRIVVLGESAALGDPLSDFGPPRMLQKMLRLRYPGRKIEVINGAITAINSHVIREIARELPTLRPDVVILYIGNNEVIGPFGPGTVYDGFFASDGLVRAMVLASRLRLMQVGRFAISAALEGRIQTDFEGLAMFTNRPVAHDDPRLAAVRRRFDRNLRAILQSVRAAGAEPLLCTVAVNRQDCPPILSLHRRGMAPGDLARWESVYQQGRDALARADWPGALAAFAQAAALDDTHAELAWLTGFCLDQTGQLDRANESYRRACELDAFRYRADESLNNDLRRLAAGLQPRPGFLDADLLFQTNSLRADAELFIDHVHFTPKGSHLLAAGWAQALADMAPFRDMEAGPIPTLAEIQDLLLYTPFFDLEFTRSVVKRHSKPPFTAQYGSSNRVARLLLRNDELERTVETLDLDALGQAVAAHRQADPGDPYYSYHWGQFLFVANRYREAESALRDAQALAPHRMNMRLQLARILAAARRPEEAAAAVLDGRRKHGYFAAAETFTTISVLLANGMDQEALAFCRAVHHGIRTLDYRWRIARAVAQLEHIVRAQDAARNQIAAEGLAAAMPAWRALLDVRRDMPEPFFWIGAFHALRGNPGQAEPFLTQAWRRWSVARGAYFRGLLLARTGQLEEARAQLERAARQAGDDVHLLQSLAWVFREHPRPQLRDEEQAARLLASAGQDDPSRSIGEDGPFRPMGGELFGGGKLP